MSKSTITYDDKKNQYQVSAGAEFLTFPGTPEGHQAAIEAGIKLDDPQVYAAAFYLAHDLFRHRRQLQARVWRAARLLVDGRVRKPFPQDGMQVKARVQPERDDNRHPIPYRVRRFQTASYVCDCFDFLRNPSIPKVQGQRMCIHIMAYKVQKLVKQYEIEPLAAEYDRNRAVIEENQRRNVARQRAIAVQNIELTEALRGKHHPLALLAGNVEEEEPTAEPPSDLEEELEELNNLLFD